MHKERVNWVDYGKALGIILMVYGHLNKQWFPALGTSIEWIYTFHMPFFFMLSGVFFSTRTPLMTFAEKKMKSLIVPYYCFSLLAFVKPVKNMISGGFQKPYGMIYLLKVLYQQMVEGDGLWFLMCLFVCDLILYGICKKCKNAKQESMAVLALTVIGYVWKQYVGITLPFQFVGALCNLMFVYMGYIFTKEKIWQKVNTGAACVLIMMWALLNCLSMKIYGAVRSESNMVLYYVIPAAMSIGLASLLYNMAEKIKKWKLLDHTLTYVGVNSLVFYIFNDVVLKILKYVVFVLAHVSLENAGIAMEISVGIAMVIVCMIFLYGISRFVNRYLPWMLGKARSKKSWN